MITPGRGSKIILILFLSVCVQFNCGAQQPFTATGGVLDLQEWDVSEDGPVNLSGEWGFYWKQLLGPDEVGQRAPDYFIPVPDTWDHYDVEETANTPSGFATYSLTLRVPDPQQTYALFVERQGSAYSLWVDGRLLAQNGRVGTDHDTMTPGNEPISVTFRPDGESVELVLQISNFYHRKGGFRNPIVIGLPDTIRRHQNHSWFIEGLSFGILFVMGFYHIFLYAFRPGDKASLFFAVLCWASALRASVTNMNILGSILPFVGWAAALRLEYLVFFLSPLLFALFVRSLYPKDVHRWFVRVVFGFGIAFTIFMVFTSTMVLSYTASYYQIIFLLEIVYLCFFLVRILARRREGALYIALASFVLFTAVVIEILAMRDLLPVGQVTSYGFLGFIFAQSVLLSSRLSKSYKEVENLSVELAGVNDSLGRSESKYRNLFEDSKDVIFIAGMDSRIEDVSPSCEDVLGYTKEELGQKTTRDIVPDKAAFVRFREAILNHGSIVDVEVELLRKDGRKIDALISATARRSEDGEMLGFQGSVRDITARKQAETERLRALELEQLAVRDPLTKTYNRRFFHDAAQNEIERAKRIGSVFSVVMLDIDHFKDVNDNYGHLTGDTVVSKVAELSQQHTRAMDLVARFGGDEFIILMPETNAETARKIAERLREIIAGKTLAKYQAIDISITISLGIAEWGGHQSTELNDLLDRADRALYQAKEGGRNRVVVSSEDQNL